MPGSNYSSPRSSISSYDSKGSSPRTSLVNPTPPPPYDFHRHTNQHHSSPQSSISTVSLDSSRHSSPRGSLGGGGGPALNITFERYPLRGSGGEHRYVTTRSGMTAEIGSTPDGTRMVTVTPAPRQAVGSLMDRFNEHAPPPPYEQQHSQRVKTIHVSHVPGSHHHHHQTPPNMPAGPNYRVGRHQPSLVQAQAHPHSHSTPTYKSSTEHILPSTSGTIQVQCSLPQQTNSAVVYQASPNDASNTAMVNKLRGLNYDVVPPKHEGPSEAEKKLAALTQQLENEMHIGSKRIPDRDHTEPPPPYHGPHITGSQISNYTNLPAAPTYTSVHSGSASPASSLGTPSTSKLSLSATSLKSPVLPVQVTPPKTVGPTEAEKKLEVLTQELEAQLEKNPQGDYYGEFGRKMKLIPPVPDLTFSDARGVV